MPFRPLARRLLAATVVLAALGAAGSAGAATTTGTGAWGDLEGDPGAYRTTMQLPGLGNPVARVTSDASAASLPSGATTWWGAATPPGALFGSSQDAPYLNLRPVRDDATSPSTTTYTFAKPPAPGWGLVLGDIDSDQVRLTATLADGATASVADLGFRGVFNPCDVSPKPSGCSTTDPKDTPTWDPATGVLIGNPTGQNTYGADAWFVPTVPLRSLTLVFTRRTGRPVFQTWFAARAQDVTGTLSVSTGTCDVTATRLSLLDADGAVLDRTRPAADGSYSFTKVAAADGFRVVLDEVPPVCAPVGPTSVPVDLRTADAVADFTLAEQASGTVGGSVTAGGDPVPGAVVRVTDGDGDPVGQDTTDATGRYDVPDAPVADLTATVDPPAGYAVVGDDSVDVTVPAPGATATADFALRRVVPPTGPGGSAGSPTSGGAAHEGTATSAASSTTARTDLPDTGGVDGRLPVLGGGLVLAGLALLTTRRGVRRGARG